MLAEEGPSKGSRLGHLYFAIYRYLPLPVYAVLWLGYWLLPFVRRRLGPRLALSVPGTTGESVIWFHASSVGETSTIAPVVTEVARRVMHGTAVVTTMTASGQRRARDILDSAEIFILPFDLYPCMRRLMAALKPSLLVIGETEIWPNLIVEARRAGVPIVLVNGRISKKSFPRYKLIRPLTEYLLSSFDLLLMRAEADVGRIVDLGAVPARVQALGNLKYDNLPEPLDEDLRRRTRLDLGLECDCRVITLGSARDGESEIVLRAVSNAGFDPQPLVIVAPRHLRLVPQIEQACSNLGYSFETLVEGESRAVSGHERTDVLVFAQMGCLLEIYSVSDVAIVGGTFRPFGGHNPLEPASQGCVTIVGPHIQNIRDDIEYLRARGCAFVTDEDSLSGLLREFMGDGSRRLRIGEAAMDAVRERRGIAAKCVDIMAANGLLPRAKTDDGSSRPTKNQTS
jgi:3-deoxy-D-manno-octulosonic-acid transferase